MGRKDITVIRIPPSLLCVSIMGPGTSRRVPFPVGSEIVPIDIGYEGDEERMYEEAVFYREYARESPFFIVSHPESQVGILCLYVDQYVEKSLLFVKLNLVSRVFLVNDHVDEKNRVYSEWRMFDEIVPDKDVFSNKAFQAKIDKLRELHAKFLINIFQMEQDKNEPEDASDDGENAVSFLPDKHSRESISRYIDQLAYKLNDFVDEPDVARKLLQLLHEKDVSKRLDGLISLYVYSLENVKRWLRPVKRYSRSGLIKTLLVGGSIPVKLSEDNSPYADGRAKLIRKLLTNPATPKPDKEGK